MIDTTVLKERIILSAISGKLVAQNDEEGTAADLMSCFTSNAKNITEINSDDMMFDIPESWKWCRFNEIANFHLGKTPARGSKTYWDNGVYPWVSISDIPNDGHIYKTREKVSERASKECFSSGISKVGTLIMSFKLTIGKVAILEMDAFHNEAIISIFPRYDEDNIFRDYLFWILPYIAQNTNSYGAIKGNTLNKNSLSDMLIPVPPLLEQQRIVSRLKEIFEQIRIIENSQSEYLMNLDTIRDKVVDAGIRGLLTERKTESKTAEDLYFEICEKKKQMEEEGLIKKSAELPAISDDEIPFDIPQNWKWVRLGDISSKISSGNTPAGGKKSNAYVENGYCFFREQNIYNDGIHDEGMVFISEELLKTRKNSTVLSKDILLNITGGSIGRCTLIPDDFDRGSINQHILIIRMVDERLRFYIHKVLCSPYAQKYIKNKAVGDKDGFSGGRCKQMLIPLPPLAEQKDIVEKINDVLLSIS